MKKLKDKPTEIKKITLQEIVREDATEKFLLSLPSGILVSLESSKRSVEQLANLGIGSVNEVMRFHELLKSKTKGSYLG